jgi:hypothetical protein
MRAVVALLNGDAVAQFNGCVVAYMVAQLVGML